MNIEYLSIIIYYLLDIPYWIFPIGYYRADMGRARAHKNHESHIGLGFQQLPGTWSQANMSLTGSMGPIPRMATTGEEVGQSNCLIL